jgi:acetylornithine deacetylase
VSIAADLAAVVQVPSVTGDERAVLERFAGIAEDAGLEVDLHQHDLAARLAEVETLARAIKRVLEG